MQEHLRAGGDRGVRRGVVPAAKRRITLSMIPIWWLSRDGDATCRQLYHRHYSHRKYSDGRQPKKFVGPGKNIVLRTAKGDAFFVWRQFKDDCIDERTGKPQAGINCSAFRNEGAHLSSELIRQADAIADCWWPGERHYTYVNPKSVRSRNPGFCFLMAGWQRCGYTQSGLLILERS